MEDDAFDTDAWLRRIGLERPLPPTLGTLHAVVAAHATTIPFENIDVLLGRVPLLDLASLQRKIVAGGRGGYCFELNTLLRAGLTKLGFPSSRADRAGYSRAGYQRTASGDAYGAAR